TYEPMSLNNNRTWTAAEVLKKVLEELGVTAGVQIDSSFEGAPIENLEISDRGDHALRKCLKAVPGLEIHVDYDGTLVLTDALKRRQSAYTTTTRDVAV